MLIGADPEFFLRDKTNGKFKAAVGLIGGTKTDPKQISDEGHAIQEDNVMVEFNVPPSDNSKKLYDNIQYVLDHITDTIIPDNLECVIKPSAQFEESELQTEQAKEFGCDPDYCVWTEKVNDSPNPNMTMRFAGGHVHIGHDDPGNIQLSLDIVKACDVFLGVPSILLDEDEERRKYYGKSGTFRIKKYGVEYRTLSNFWIGSQKLVDFVTNNTKRAYENAMDGMVFNNQTEKDIQKCINTVDKSLAENLCNEFNIQL